jgi:hypothetical protein
MLHYRSARNWRHAQVIGTLLLPCLFVTLPDISVAASRQSHPVLQSHEFLHSVVQIGRDLPLHMRQAVGDFLVSRISLRELGRQLDTLQPIPRDVLERMDSQESSAIPQEIIEFAETAGNKSPTSVARQLGNLDMLLFSRDGAGFDAPGTAFLTAHGAVSERQRRRLITEFRRTLRELGIPPAEGAGSVLDLTEATRQEGQGRVSPLFQMRLRNRIVPLTEEQFFNQFKVQPVSGLYTDELSPEQLTGLRAVSRQMHRELLPTRRVISDAYAQHVIENRQADVYIARTRIEQSFQRGLFAGRPIERYGYIGDFAGVVRPDHPPRGSHYAYEYPFVTNIIIDGRDRGNVMRFINTSVSSNNVYSLPVFSKGLWHMVLIAQRRIEEGEQLLLDYGIDFFKNKRRPEDLRP